MATENTGQRLADALRSRGHGGTSLRRAEVAYCAVQQADLVVEINRCGWQHKEDNNRYEKAGRGAGRSAGKGTYCGPQATRSNPLRQAGTPPSACRHCRVRYTAQTHTDLCDTLGASSAQGVVAHENVRQTGWETLLLRSPRQTTRLPHLPSVSCA